MRGRLHSERGFTLIETLIAAFVLVVGILGLILGLDSSRRLSLVAERQTTMAHVAQKETERLDTEPYSRLEMSAAPTHSSETSNPDYYVTGGATPKYQSDPANAETNEQLAVAGAACTSSTQLECGAISPTPTAWSAGSSSGYIYDFVTWRADGHCGAGCEESKNYKRLTVVVTVTVPGGGQTVTAVKVSSFVTNPNAVAKGSVSNGSSDPLESPETKCGGVQCTNGIGRGNAQFWYLHDFPAAPSATPTAPTANHNVHDTTAATNTSCSTTSTSGACPVPDLIDTATAPTALTLYNYSKDLGTSPAEYAGGRVLKPGSACSVEPSGTQLAEDEEVETWVTAPLSANTKLTGYGGLSLYTQTLNASSLGVGLCVAVYDVPKSIENLVKSPPTRIGYYEYKPDAWPAEMTNVGFTFEFPAKTVSAEHRIGLRIWPTPSSPAIAIAYDAAADSSILQLNTE